MRVLKRNIKNFKIFAATLFLLFSQMVVPLTALTSTAHAAGQITFGAQFQNQTFPNDPNIWTNGQLDNYSEGDFVNFRFDLTATDATSAGTMQVEFDLGSCSFFTDYFDFVSTTPAIAGVTEGTQVLVNSGGGGSNDYYKQDLGVSFSSAGTTTVIFTLQLSNTAGDCTGSSTGVRLGVPATGNGDFDNAGAKTLPMSANSVLENPSLTITKTVEGGGDAQPADFYFTISPGINGVIDGTVVTGQTEIHIPTGGISVTINEVNPDGIFTISENGPAGYDFSGGTGTSCDVTNADDGVMQATLTADPSNPTEAICNFSNEHEPEGNIVIVKETLPDGDSQSFEFNPSYSSNFSLSDGQTNDSGPLAPGEYSVSELVPEGWTQTSAVCVDDDGNSTPASINLSDDETVTCTFTNTKQAQITVKKDAIPNDSQNFTFTNNFGNGNDAVFQLDNDGTVELPSERTFYVLPGTGYSVSEQEVDGWKLSSAECDLNNTVDAIDVVAGEHVTCTFTNKKLGSITIIKTAVGGNGTFDYTMTGESLLGSAQLITALGTDTEIFTDIDPENTYSITETPQDGWDLDSVYCENENQVEKSPTSFTINNGGNVTCTFTNHKHSSLTLRKTVINDDGGAESASSWTLSALLGTVTWIDEAPSIHVMASPTSETMATETYKIPAGDYDLSEFSSSTGYTPSDSWSCENALLVDGDTVTITIGADVVCTITNDDNAPALTVVKEVINDNGGTATVYDFDIENNDEDLAFSAGVVDGSKTTYTSTPIVKSNTDYRLTEVLAGTGYSGGSWSCTDGSEGQLGVSVNLGEGEKVTCTVTNDDQPAKLTLVKHVENNYGGTARPHHFNVYIDGNGSTWDDHYINAGTYVVSEDTLPGYEAGDWGDDCLTNGTVTLDPGEEKTCTITNYDVAPELRLKKTVVNDNGGDAQADEWLLRASISRHNRPINEHGSQTDDGNMAFTDWHELKAGTKYYLSERGPNGYSSGEWSCDGGDVGSNFFGSYVYLPLGEDVTCEVVNDDKPPKVKVIKMTYPNIFPGHPQDFDFEVLNKVSPEAQDGHFWNFTLDTDWFDREFDAWKLIELETAGVVSVEEAQVDGWKVIPFCSGNERDLRVSKLLNNDTQSDGVKIERSVDIGETLFCMFINVELGDVEVTKFHDENENGHFDEGEQTLEGWEINLAPVVMHKLPAETDDGTMTQTTGEDGTTTFKDLEPKTFELSENVQEGWHQTGIYCEYPEPTLLGGQQKDSSPFNISSLLSGEYLGNDHGDVVSVVAGEQVDCFIGNVPDPVLEIVKSNDTPEPTVTGDTVTYTITVIVPEDSGCVYRGLGEKPSFVQDEMENGYYRNCETDEEVKDFVQFISEVEIPEVTVTDLPPEGFGYIPGSWTANSTVRGDLKALLITPEPTYASPGQWGLTNAGSPFLIPGEVVTLTYQALIDGAVTNGDYPDTAFVQGYTSDGMSDVFGNIHLTGNDPFVGTEVSVLDTEEEEQGFVLGTSTLAVTGVPAIMSVAMGMLIATGAILVSGGGRKKRGLLKGFGKSLFMLALGLGISMFVFGSAFATGFWTTNLSTPEAFTTTGVVNLDYQVSSTDAADTFTVELLKDGSMILSESVVTPYGDSGRFPIVLPDEGTFTFKTEATNLNGGGMLPSQEVTVTYDGTAPAEAVYDGVVRSGDIYTVSFTAPTGDVSSVNVYASTQTSFGLDASTLVGTVAVTSGESSQFVYTAPDSAQRYFAITAQDAAGNQSTATGDEVVTTVVTTVPGDTSGTGGSTAGAGDDGTVGDDAAQADTGVEGTTDEDADADGGTSSTTVIAIAVIILAIVLGGAYLYSLSVKKD